LNLSVISTLIIPGIVNFTDFYLIYNAMLRSCAFSQAAL